MVGDYHGDHAAIKTALNGTIGAVKGYIDEISSILSEMANGNMAQEIKAEYKGSFITLKDSINTIIDSMNATLTDIKNSANQVAAGTNQVSIGSQSLAQGANEQASSVEELSASIEEISTQTQENAANATAANERTLVAKSSADRGNEQMKGMLQSMEAINEASNSISKIIKGD